MRILDVSPRVVHPPTRGSSVRAANLLRALAERHEVRQLSQARVSRRGDPEGARGRFAVTPSYAELRMAAPVATAATELGARSWVRAPVLSGVGLGPSRRLRAQVEWADVVLVEFPWQFAACRRARSDVPIVLAGCNVEAAKFADYAAPSVRRGRRRSGCVWSNGSNGGRCRAPTSSSPSATPTATS